MPARRVGVEEEEEELPEVVLLLEEGEGGAEVEEGVGEDRKQHPRGREKVRRLAAAKR